MDEGNLSVPCCSSNITLFKPVVYFLFLFFSSELTPLFLVFHIGQIVTNSWRNKHYHNYSHNYIVKQISLRTINLKPKAVLIVRIIARVVLSAEGGCRHCPSQNPIQRNPSVSDQAMSESIPLGLHAQSNDHEDVNPGKTSRQDTDQRGLCKHWSGNSPQRVVGGWISVWCCLSHSWR
jgi:hypothetical protein